MTLLKRAEPEIAHGRVRIIDGQIYPRVTTVIGETLRKPGLEAWWRKHGFAKCDELSKTAVAWGSRLHAWLEKVNRDPAAATNMATLPPHTPDDLVPYIGLYLDWLTGHVDRVLAVEKLVVSRAHGFCGTLDVALEMRDGTIAIADFKSDKAGPWPVKPEQRMQLAAYRLALAEQDGVIASRRLLLQLPRDEPCLIVHKLGQHKADTEAFMACLRIWRWKERLP